MASSGNFITANPDPTPLSPEEIIKQFQIPPGYHARVTQQPYGQGGVLLTDKKYKNFELYIKVKIDSFTNGGILIRSTESGVAYQIKLDEIAKSTGNLHDINTEHRH